VLREAQLRQAEQAAGQASLFDFGDTAASPERPVPPLPDVPRWPESERLTREKEILGFFISGHPLERYRDELRAFSAVTTSNLKQFRDQKVELPCVVTAVAKQMSKRDGSEWGRITVEDFSGTATVLAFRDAWENHHDLLVQDAAVLVRGSVSGRDRDEEAPPIFLDSAVPLASLRNNGSLALEVELRPDIAADALATAAEAFRAHPGASPVFVRWQPGHEEAAEGNGGGHGNGAGTNGGGPPAELRLRSRSLTVAPDDTLLRELRELFGAERIRLVRTS
jgi:DNA polymerase-3 subunit alpha